VALVDEAKAQLLSTAGRETFWEMVLPVGAAEATSVEQAEMVNKALKVMAT
jgi:hypothetical protein